MADTSDDDIRHDDLEFNPQLEPKKAKAWLNLLEESETAFEKWNDHCDRIDKLYANLEALSSMARDKQFQMFWANAEVIKPSIYAKAPQPVVVTKFKDRRPVPQAAAELLERVTTVAFDLAHIDPVMKQIRDDVVLHGRGVPWARYESGNADGYYDHEKVCIDFKHRRDFLHGIARCWYEVPWVAGASYLTRAQARERFKEYSGDEYQDAEYKVDRDAKEVGGADDRERAKFWEIWDKENQRCVWVAKGCENILDEDKKHLDLQDFFPCPCPAYGTVQPGSLIPVPDVMQYKDQLDEINLLTSKIHALSSALEAKGFYPSGTAELGEAIEAALAINTPNRLLVPIANWAAFGGTKDVIVWLPIAEIAQTITQCVTLREQVVQDVYQITGLSDIMRGQSDPRETMGAQELKSQFGSIRTREKQNELVRVARDLVVIASDIITDKFKDTTIIQMSQTQLPTQAMQKQQVQKLVADLQQKQRMLDLAKQMAAQPPAPGGPPPGGPPGQPPGMGMMQAPPQQPQVSPEQLQPLLAQGEAMLKQGQDAITQTLAKPNFDQVMTFLRDQRTRAFVLDVETDSTILIDENTAKQRSAEFIGVLAQLLPQLTQMVATAPESAPFCGEILKFSVAPYRAGRALDGAIDDFVLQMEAKANQPRGDDPATAQSKTALQIEQMKDSRERAKDATDADLKRQELTQKDQHEKDKLEAHKEIEYAKLKQNNEADSAKAQQIQLKGMHDREEHQATMLEHQAGLEETAQKIQSAERMQSIKERDMQNRGAERVALQQFKMSQPQNTGRPF